MTPESETANFFQANKSPISPFGTSSKGQESHHNFLTSSAMEEELGRGWRQQLTGDASDADAGSDDALHLC